MMKAEEDMVESETTLTISEDINTSIMMKVEEDVVESETIVTISEDKNTSTMMKVEEDIVGSETTLTISEDKNTSTMMKVEEDIVGSETTLTISEITQPEKQDFVVIQIEDDEVAYTRSTVAVEEPPVELGKLEADNKNANEGAANCESSENVDNGRNESSDNGENPGSDNCGNAGNNRNWSDINGNIDMVNLNYLNHPSEEMHVSTTRYVILLVVVFYIVYYLIHGEDTNEYEFYPDALNPIYM